MTKLLFTLIPAICLVLSCHNNTQAQGQGQGQAQTEQLITSSHWKISEVTTPDTGYGVGEYSRFQLSADSFKASSEIIFNPDHTFKSHIAGADDKGTWKLNLQGDIEVTSYTGNTILFKASEQEKETFDVEVKPAKDPANTDQQHLNTFVLHFVKAN